MCDDSVGAGTVELTVVVEADSEKEAILKGMSVDWSMEIKSSDETIEIDEIDTFKTICEGNVLYVPLNRAKAEEA